jgi:hypothetical protein
MQHGSNGKLTHCYLPEAKLVLNLRCYKANIVPLAGCRGVADAEHACFKPFELRQQYLCACCLTCGALTLQAIAYFVLCRAQGPQRCSVQPWSQLRSTRCPCSGALLVAHKLQRILRTAIPEVRKAC